MPGGWLERTVCSPLRQRLQHVMAHQHVKVDVAPTMVLSTTPVPITCAGVCVHCGTEAVKGALLCQRSGTLFINSPFARGIKDCYCCNSTLLMGACWHLDLVNIVTVSCTPRLAVIRHLGSCNMRSLCFGMHHRTTCSRRCCSWHAPRKRSYRHRVLLALESWCCQRQTTQRHVHLRRQRWDKCRQFC